MNNLFGFDPVRIQSYHSNYDDKIKNNQKLSDSEKVALGKDLAKIEGDILNRAIFDVASKSWKQTQDYYKARADRYIRYLKANISADQKSTPKSETPALHRAHAVGKETLLSPSQVRENQKKIMISTLGIDVLPETLSDESIYLYERDWFPPELNKFYEEMQAKKMELVEVFDLKLAEEAQAQSRQFPLSMTMINEIKNSFEELDECCLRGDKAAADKVIARIKTQLSNFSRLTKEMRSLCRTEEDQKALANVTVFDLIEEKEKSKEEAALIGLTLYQIFKGETKIPENFSAILKKQFEYKKSSKAEDVKRQPLSSTAITGQADLQKATREGKMWASQQQQLQPLGTSANLVYRLHTPGSQEASAYFKITKSGEEYGSTMEKLVWDIAVWMGVEDSFVPTGTTQVRTQPELQGGTKKIKQWTPTELVEISTAKPIGKGGVQPAQKGDTLSQYLAANKPPVKDSEVIKAMVVSLTFGMYDTHYDNIFVTDEGKIKFFDNTRSLAHSNISLSRGTGLASPFRSSLLSLKTARKPLTTQQRTDIENEISILKQKSAKLKEYLKNPQVEKSQATLPPGWFNAEDVLQAMKDRIEAMELAIKNPAVKTLEDLVCETIPNYKFFFAIALLKMDYFNLTDADQEEYRLKAHSAVGRHYIDISIVEVAKKGYDLDKIKKWCDDKTKSLDDIVELVDRHDLDVSQNPPNLQESQRRLILGSFINLQLEEQSKYDFKDRDSKSSKEIALHLNYAKMKKYNMDFESFVDKKELQAFLRKNKTTLMYVFAELKDGSLFVVLNAPHGEIYLPVDIQKQIDFMAISGTLVPIKDVSRWLQRKIAEEKLKHTSKQ